MKPKKSNKKLLLLLIPTLFLVVGCILYVLEVRGIIDIYKKNNSYETSNSPTGEIPSANPTNTVDYNSANPSDNEPIPDKDPNATTPEPVNSDLTATITSTRKNSTGDLYLVKVAVAGTESGSCYVEMTKDSQTVSDTADIALSAGQYSCSGLELPLSSLGSGEWDVEVTVTDSNGAKASATTKAII